MVLSEAARSLIFTWSCVRGETGGCQPPRGRERPAEGTPEQGRLEPTTGATKVSIPQDLGNVTRTQRRTWRLQTRRQVAIS